MIATRMHKLALTKRDGRAIILYGRQPVALSSDLLELPQSRSDTGSHFRWHPLRGEWVIYAAHRQHRTFLPPPDDNPLAPSREGEHPTELPHGSYDVAVFENLFPTMTVDVEDVLSTIVETRPGKGICEVIVYAQQSTISLGALELSHLELILEVLGDRYAELGARPDIQYVFPFENRGVEMGVTLHHPHGQIYAYPFVPPIAAAELHHQSEYYRTHGRGLLEQHIEKELHDGSRVLYDGAHVIAFVPAFARYAYEVWIAPKTSVPSLTALTVDQRRDFARALKTVLLKYDGLWSKRFPYVMAIHQAPTDGKLHPESHLHFEFYSAYRMPGQLKYLAGSEVGAGVFTADTLPELKAAELQAVKVDLNG
jgi:UDPglucose--hexose-1-phosphate uridylyltransferase